MLSTPFNEFRAPKISCLFNDARLSRLQSMWRTWSPNISVPTKEYLSSIPALWVHKEDLSEAIPLALIMIWERKGENERKKMIPLMDRVNYAVNFDIDLGRRQRAHEQYVSQLKEEIHLNSEGVKPSIREAELLLKESTRQGHSIISYRVGKGYRATFPCPVQFIPEEDAF